MGRQRIGKIEWYDEKVWQWLLCAITALLSLWAAIYFNKGLGFIFAIIFFLLFVSCLFFILFVAIKTVLEIDADFLYVVNIRCFIRFVKTKIRIKDIVCIDFYLISRGRYTWLFPKVKVTDFSCLRKYENIEAEIIERNGKKTCIQVKYADDVFKYLDFLKKKAGRSV